uniref:Chromosome 9 open reading frame 50 n=1 Tax=Microcebus murinus TaxID=30608 RepID=A0A8C5VJ67_MICMU
MFRRPLYPGAREARKEFPGDGDFRRREPLLPRLTSPELRAVRLARSAAGSRVAGGGAAWWQDSDAKSRGYLGGPQRRLPDLSPEPPRAAQKRNVLSSVLLPPLHSTSAPRGPAPRCPGPGECEHSRGGAARRRPGSLGALIEEFLPSRFREFLQQLQQKCAEPPEPLTSSASRHQRAVPQHCRGSHQCPHCSFLPDLWGQSSYFQDSLKKILLHQILPWLMGDGSVWVGVGEKGRPHGAQVPKVKAVPTRSSSGEASGPRRRCCPFRVRFADETLQDTALRYWERNCAVRQHITENRTSTLPAVSERLLGSVGRWLESLPKTLNPRAKEEALTSSCWNFPSPPTQEPQGHFSEDTPMNNRLPYIPRATTQRQRGDLRSLLNTHNILEQVGKSPSSLGPKLQPCSPPQGVPALLPSMTLRQAQR